MTPTPLLPCALYQMRINDYYFFNTICSNVYLINIATILLVLVLQTKTLNFVSHMQLGKLGHVHEELDGV